MSMQARSAGAWRPRPKGRIAARPNRWFSAGGSFVRTRRRARTRSSVRGVSGRPAVAALARSRSSGGDVLLALAIFAFALIAASGKHHGAAAQALLYALAAVGTLPLLVRRLFPVPVLASWWQRRPSSGSAIRAAGGRSRRSSLSTPSPPIARGGR